MANNGKPQKSHGHWSVKLSVIRIVRQEILLLFCTDKDGLLDSSDAFIGVLHDVLAPEPEHGPVNSLEAAVVSAVALDVSADLLHPVAAVAAVFQAQSQFIPVFSVEEFTVAENSDLVPCQYDVRSSRKPFVILAVSVAFVP